METNNEWLKGYACAVANLIHMEGSVTAQIRELYRAGGLWKYCILTLNKTIDPSDAEIFESHWNELQ